MPYFNRIAILKFVDKWLGSLVAKLLFPPRITAVQNYDKVVDPQIPFTKRGDFSHNLLKYISDNSDYLKRI